MKVFAFASKDTFITDAVIKSTFRATDANVGSAGTLDLFKLHDESILPGSASGVQEISRVLIKFDLTPIYALTATGEPLNGTKINNATFRLRMYDLLHSDTVPSSFKLIVFPLSKSFDEGPGLDAYSFQDLGAANFITASGLNSTAVAWAASGANQGGYYQQESIDYITGSAAFPGLGSTNLFATQAFDDGTEDLNMDITTIVSATIVGLLPDFGLRLSFSGTEETDQATRFIKRFYSRHATVYSKQPRIEAIFDDSFVDNSSNFEFDVTGTIFLKNATRGKLVDIVSGSQTLTGTSADVSSGTPKTSWAVPVVKLESGSFNRVFTASKYDTGLYSASFAISSLEQALTGEIRAVNSATFKVFWQSASQTVPYLTSSMVIKEISRATFSKPKRYKISISNLKREYHIDEIAQFRLFIKETNYTVNAEKLPSDTNSTLINEMYYQIRELRTNDIVMPFDTVKQSTRISYDTHSNFFNLRMSSLAPGRNFKLEFMIIEDDIQQVIDEKIIFRVYK